MKGTYEEPPELHRAESHGGRAAASRGRRRSSSCRSCSPTSTSARSTRPRSGIRTQREGAGRVRDGRRAAPRRECDRRAGSRGVGSAGRVLGPGCRACTGTRGARRADRGVADDRLRPRGRRLRERVRRAGPAFYAAFVLLALVWVEIQLATTLRNRDAEPVGLDAASFYLSFVAGIGVLTWIVLYLA